MSLYDSELWISDIDRIIENLPELAGFNGKRIMITGASGLICSAVADVFIRFIEKNNADITLFLCGRNIERLVNRFKPFAEREYIHFVKYDAAETDSRFPEGCDYIIHGAGNASPGVIVKEPVETMLDNFIGIKVLLDYAKECGTEKVLYISSSEVYGRKEDNQPYREGQYGYIDLLNPRNSYSVGKRAAETLCVSYADEYGVKASIVRPGHIYGPTASRDDNRVSSAWAFSAAEGKDIVMKSDGSQMRSYCYCLDCASAIIVVLLRGEKSKAYNISNPDSVISIKRLAEILSETAGVRVTKEIPSPSELKGFNPMINSSLDGGELLNLGWKGRFAAEEGLSHTVQILRDS